jgi:hypothetical protein
MDVYSGYMWILYIYVYMYICICFISRLIINQSTSAGWGGWPLCVALFFDSAVGGSTTIQVTPEKLMCAIEQTTMGKLKVVSGRW